MLHQLCIHCSQKPPCPYQDGIYCKVTPCIKDNTGDMGATGDFIKNLQNLFGGGSRGNPA